MRRWLRRHSAELGIALFVTIVGGVIVAALTDVFGFTDDDRGAHEGVPLSPRPAGEGQRTDGFHPATCGPLSRRTPRDATDDLKSLPILDVTMSARLHDQDGREGTDFADSTRASQGDVVQFGILAYNAEFEETGRTARNFRLRIQIPLEPAQVLSTLATAEADNTDPGDAGHKLTDSATLRAHGGRRIYLTGIRNPQFQPNRAKQEGKFDWGRLITIPEDCAVETRRSRRHYEMVLPGPAPDGSLGPGRLEMFRLVFLADVNTR